MCLNDQTKYLAAKLAQFHCTVTARIADSDDDDAFVFIAAIVAVVVCVDTFSQEVILTRKLRHVLPGVVPGAANNRIKDVHVRLFVHCHHVA